MLVLKIDHLAYEVLKHKNGIADQKADAHAEVPDENKPGVFGQAYLQPGNRPLGLQDHDREQRYRRTDAGVSEDSRGQVSQAPVGRMICGML